MKPSNDIEHLIKRFRIKPSAGMHERNVNDVLAAQEESQKIQSTAIQPNIGKTIMKSRITKLSAAAAIIVAVFAGIYQFAGSIDGASVAWADVVRQIDQMETLVWSGTTVITSIVQGRETSRVVEQWKYFRKDPNSRSQIEYQRADVSEPKPATQPAVSHFEPSVVIHSYSKTRSTNWYLCPFQKKAKRVINNYELVMIDEPPDMVAEHWNKFKNISSDKARRIGQREINGIQAVGFAAPIQEYEPTFGGEGEIHVWVDKETAVPIFVEMEFRRKIGKIERIERGIASDIEWNVPLPDDLFEPPALEDWTIVEDIEFKHVPFTNTSLKPDVTLRVTGQDGTVILTEHDIEKVRDATVMIVRKDEVTTTTVSVGSILTQAGRSKMKAYTLEHIGEKLTIDFNSKIQHEDNIHDQFDGFAIDITKIGKTVKQFEEDYLTANN